MEHDLDADGEPERIVLSRESPNPASWQYGMDPGEYCAVLIYQWGSSDWKLVFDSRENDIILEGDFFEDSEAVHFADHNGNGYTEILLRQYAFASHPPALVMIEFDPSGYREIFHKCIGGFEFRDLNQDGRYELLGSVGATSGSGSGIGADLGKAQLGSELIQENADLFGDDLDYIALEFDCELKEDKRSLEEAMSE